MHSMMMKVLLSTCAVCAIAQAPAFAQPTPPPPQPVNVPPGPTAIPANPASPAGTNPTDPSNRTYLPDPGAPATDPGLAPDASGPAAVPPIDNPSTTAVDPTTSGGALVNTDPSLGDGDSLSYAWTERRLASGIGISTLVGGGVVGFTDKTMRNTTSSAGGLWDLRVTLGSHLPIALDLSYVGSATNINGLPSARKGTLVGTTAEAALRYNILPHYAFTPYVFGGAGWQRYDVTQTNVSLSDSGMNDKDNLLEFPMGVGFAYRTGGLVADIRGTFRATTDQNLVLKTPTLSPTSDDFAPMHTWEASAAIGYEF
jgi:hypothetical protein